jgi:glycyl-tRNA synthetase beta chain
MANDLLIEILCEELPPKGLRGLVDAFKVGMEKGLNEASISFEKIEEYASPRRLALIVKDLNDKQDDRQIQKQGPAVSHAFDSEGKPTKAALGFARGCGVEVDALSRIQTKKGEWLSYLEEKKGADSLSLLEAIVNKALEKLPIPKPMRWGNGEISFVRPVHGALMLFGDKCVEATILGKSTTNSTVGHRFHHPAALQISHASEYEAALEQVYVVASFEKRREKVLSEIQRISSELDATPVFDEALLEEITNIIEWPIVLLGSFDSRFLDVPSEVLITSMASHQKYVSLKDKAGNLLPHFIVVSNIKSEDQKRVVEGNEKVIAARLSDSVFFYEKDKETTLESKTTRLKSVVFQEKLGTLEDKVARMRQLSRFIGVMLNVDEKHLERAVVLSKADLLTEMVGEFPSLQGVMGRYYALHDNEQEEVAAALYEQYLPRFSGDELPKGNLGKILALSERLDTLVGIFGIGQKPTGVKDPFKCRRQALGVVRILLAEKAPLNLKALLAESQKAFGDRLINKDVVQDVYQFIVERLRVYFTSQGVRYDVVNAVVAVKSDSFNTLAARIEALSHFVKSEQASSLIQAFKRVRKLFEKENIKGSIQKIDISLFDNDHEKNLYQEMDAKKKDIAPLLIESDFTQVLNTLALLKGSVDAFFDGVMVLVEDKRVRDNRLALLSALEETFSKVASLAELQ